MCCHEHGGGRGWGEGVFSTSADLAYVLRRAGRAAVGVDDLLEYLGTEDEQHDLQRPDVALLLVAVGGDAVEELEQLVAALGQLIVGPTLVDVGELLRVVVHPVPNCLPRKNDVKTIMRQSYTRQ